MSAHLADWMSPAPVRVTPETSLRECAIRMGRAGVRHLPVVEDGRPIGLLTDVDLAMQGVLVGLDDLWVPWTEVGPQTAGQIAGPVAALPASGEVDRAIRALLEEHREAVLAVDADGALAGVFTEHDAVRVAMSRIPAGASARSIASAPVVSVFAEVPAVEAWELLQTRGIRHVLLLRGGLLSGVVSERDLLAEGVHEGRELTCEEVSRSLDVAAVALDAPAALALSALVDLRIGCAPLVDHRGVPLAVVTRTDAMRAALA
jgi:CBS domain-containing protein